MPDIRWPTDLFPHATELIALSSAFDELGVRPAPPASPVPPRPAPRRGKR